MSTPHDPTIKAVSPPRAMAPQAPGICGLCLGAGHYLEVFCGDPAGQLVSVQCHCCGGSGHRASK